MKNYTEDVKIANARLTAKKDLDEMSSGDKRDTKTKKESFRKSNKK